MLDRYLLRYFLAVIDHGTFSRAADACNVAQPTLSVGIAKLERIVGRTLFIRSNQRVELTDAGSHFLVHARRIERDFHTAMQSMGTAAEQTSFRLGVLGSIPSGIVAAGVAAAGDGHQYRFELVYGSERELIGHLAKGRIDVALTLTGRGGDRFSERVIKTEGYALALPRSHPHAGLPEIAAELLANEPMIVRRHCEALSETSRHFTERGVRPHFTFRSTNDERVLEMVAAGLGVTVVPDGLVHPGVVNPRLVGFSIRRTLGWVAAHGAEHLLAAPNPLMKSIQHGLASGAA